MSVTGKATAENIVRGRVSELDTLLIVPVRGVDYWTEEDKTEIINEVVARVLARLSE